MKNIVISTLPREHKEAAAVILELKEKFPAIEVLYAEDYKIAACVGCNYCWLKTPGVCSIQDDYPKFYKKYLAADHILFLTETKLGFVSYKMKNMVDRLVPLDMMYLKVKDGQMRHRPRYDKELKMGVLYIGEGDETYLSHWMDREMLNLSGISLGAYGVERRKELYHALNNH